MRAWGGAWKEMFVRRYRYTYTATERDNGLNTPTYKQPPKGVYKAYVQHKREKNSEVSKRGLLLFE